MTKDDRADSSAPTPCSSADGSQSPHDASRSSVECWNPTICKRGREVVLIFDTFEEADAAFDLIVDFQPRILPVIHDGD